MHPTARSTAGVRRRAILPLRLAALPARVTAALVSAIVVAAGAAAVLSAAAPARAAEVADLYTIRVPVDQSEPDWREQAYRRALSQVLVRVTGQRAAAGDPALDALFEDPGRLVQGYRRGADETLWVSFDGRAIAARLREAGRAVWGSERPVTLLWLAVDRGGGDRELIAAEDEPAPATLPGRSARPPDGADPDRFLRQRVEDVARARGLPLVWPLLDAEDRSSVAFSDVWGGFEQPVLEASSRYGANSILLGRIDADGRQLPRWTWYFGGEQRQWRASVEDAVHRVADLMAGQLAALGDERASAVRLTVTGVEDLAAYADISRYLASVSVVRDLRLVQLADNALTYRLELLGAPDRLGRVLRLSGRFGTLEEIVDATRVGEAGGAGAVADLTVAYRP